MRIPGMTTTAALGGIAVILAAVAYGLWQKNRADEYRRALTTLSTEYAQAVNERRATEDALRSELSAREDIIRELDEDRSRLADLLEQSPDYREWAEQPVPTAAIDILLDQQDRREEAE